MVEQLTFVLKNALEQKKDLQAVVTALETIAPTTRDRQESSAETYRDLVKKYHESQASQKSAKNKVVKPMKSTSLFFSLNFAKYRRVLKGYKKTTPNTQVVGFTDSDTHHDVIVKGARGLGIKCDFKQLSLLCSGGLVPDFLSEAKPWTLGEYIKLNGGTSNRSKKSWGIYIPFDEDDDMEQHNTTVDSGVTSQGAIHDRKRTICSSTVSKKHCTVREDPKCGTSRDQPVRIDSSIDCGPSESADSSDPIEIYSKDIVVKYGVSVGGNLSTSAVAVGQIGAWRLLNFNDYANDITLAKQIADGTDPFQPESHSFLAIEITIGGWTYLRADVDVGTSISMKELKFHLLKKQLVRSRKSEVITSATNHCALLALSPNHSGRTCYIWEKKEDDTWDTIDIPSSTCVLFVKSPGNYRCLIDDDFVYFEVTNEIKEESKDLLIGMKSLEFGEMIGRGSFADVFRGKWNDQVVALKKMRLPPGSDPLIVPKEVSVLRNLHHPNIVSLLAYAVDEEQVVLVTNYVDGTNLERVIFSKKFGQELSTEQSVAIVLQITEAVYYMHTRIPMVIHQDLKPHNVLVTRDLEQVYVCDMGIAKVKQVAEATVTSVNKGPGTYPYMAPEMFKKSRRGSAVDIYSLGCLFIELFGRKRVWPDLDITDIIMKVVGSYESPPQMPNTAHLVPPFGEFCRKLCNLDLSQRPSIQEVLKMIKEIQLQLK